VNDPAGVTVEVKQPFLHAVEHVYGPDPVHFREVLGLGPDVERIQSLCHGRREEKAQAAIGVDAQQLLRSWLWATFGRDSQVPIV